MLCDAYQGEMHQDLRMVSSVKNETLNIDLKMHVAV